ncbi:sugar ABC transporter ATP-binding protein [Labrys monachus]|uniref:ABC-type sugar transport system ATPase subunit n=1 Tax=Labrys monachus TaxID=217067 RepID=A0ABU0FBI5_9HYPH|nr:sugar ABC transporter ATP-binding protein [Labrys monachus]MDQ0391972.1 ABC-type sugar transport system ATPase subunit [Labrys monachus]
MAMEPTVSGGGDGGALPVPAIEARAITKAFLGTCALDGVDFAVAPGEIHGLVGKNGAGKSTFMKILSGAQPPDSGQIVVGGQAFRALNPADGRAAGIAVVYQNAELHLDLSVAANIFLGAEPRTRLGLLDDRAMARKASALLARLGLSLPVGTRLGDLDIAHRQQVAIAKAVREEARVLLLDEPTAALNKSQADFLFRLIRSLARQGMAIVYVSHHLDEVLAISDRITILRNGRKVAVVEGKTSDKDGLIAMIVGRSFGAVETHRAPAPHADPFLTLAHVSLAGRLDDVSLSVGRGEIVGLTGLVGGGANALAAVIAGIDRADGAMTLGGEPYAPRSIRAAVARGVQFIPEDMRGRGLVMPLSVAKNISLAALPKLARAWCLNLAKEHQAALAMAERLDLNPRAPDREVRFLSGGNQRKSLLGRAIFADARLFVLEEPTQGVDVESQRQIHDHLRHLADRGASVVFVSTDLEELIALADRIVVLRGGRIDQELVPAGLRPEHLLAAIQTQSTGSPH